MNERAEKLSDPERGHGPEGPGIAAADPEALAGGGSQPHEQRDGEQADRTATGSERSSSPDLIEAMGGRYGIAESVLPGIVFIGVYSLGGSQIEPAAWAAVAVAAVFAALRISRRETIQFAIAGLVGVGLSAFIASRTGRAEDFFVPGLFLNAGYAAAYAISIAVRYPLLGVIMGPLTGEGMAWRKDPSQLRAYSRASWIWVGMFVLRLAAQLPLYLAGSVVALGVVRTAMGLPLFALALWTSYLVLRAADVPWLRRGRSRA